MWGNKGVSNLPHSFFKEPLNLKKMKKSYQNPKFMEYQQDEECVKKIMSNLEALTAKDFITALFTLIGWAVFFALLWCSFVLPC